MSDNNSQNQVKIQSNTISIVEGYSPTKDDKKTINAFNNAFGSVIALMKGEENIKPTNKIPSSEMDKLLDELMKEEVESKREEFKTKMKALLQSKVKFDNLYKEELKKFHQVLFGKMKEFTKEMNDALSIIEGIHDIKKSYLQSLGNIPPVENEEETS